MTPPVATPPVATARPPIPEAIDTTPEIKALEQKLKDLKNIYGGLNEKEFNEFIDDAQATANENGRSPDNKKKAEAIQQQYQIREMRNAFEQAQLIKGRLDLMRKTPATPPLDWRKEDYLKFSGRGKEGKPPATPERKPLAFTTPPGVKPKPVAAPIRPAIGKPPRIPPRLALGGNPRRMVPQEEIDKDARNRTASEFTPQQVEQARETLQELADAMGKEGGFKLQDDGGDIKNPPKRNLPPTVLKPTEIIDGVQTYHKYNAKTNKKIDNRFYVKDGSLYDNTKGYGKIKNMDEIGNMNNTGGDRDMVDRLKGQAWDSVGQGIDIATAGGIGAGLGTGMLGRAVGTGAIGANTAVRTGASSVGKQLAKQGALTAGFVGAHRLIGHQFKKNQPLVSRP